MATLQELKHLNHISEGSQTWSFGLKVLLAALLDDYNATYALKLMSILSSLKVWIPPHPLPSVHFSRLIYLLYDFQKKKVKIRFEIIKSLINYLSCNKKSEIKWYDLSSKNSDTWLKVRILEYVLDGIYNDVNSHDEYSNLLHEFSKVFYFSLSPNNLF